MNYDLSKPIDIKSAETRFKTLLKQKACISITKKVKVRTIDSNSYLHAILTILGNELGYTLSEMKIESKRNCDFMTYQKNGSWFLKSTVQDQELFNKFVSWLRNWSSMEHGVYLPSGEEYLTNRFEIDRQNQRTDVYG